MTGLTSSSKWIASTRGRPERRRRPAPERRGPRPRGRKVPAERALSQLVKILSASSGFPLRARKASATLEAGPFDEEAARRRSRPRRRISRCRPRCRARAARDLRRRLGDRVLCARRVRAGRPALARAWSRSSTGRGTSPAAGALAAVLARRGRAAGSRQPRAARRAAAGVSASPYWTGASNAIQYRTVGRVAACAPTSSAARGSACGPKRRSSWRARRRSSRAPAGTRTSRFAARRRSTRTAVHLAIVHHTAGSNSYTKAQSASIVRAIELYHVKGNGWNDIGYNFLVDKYGQIFEGRYGGMTQAGDRRPRTRVQHRLGRDRGDRRLQLDVDHAGRAGRARLADRLAARPRRTSTRSRVSSGLVRQPALRGREAVTLRAISGHRDVYPTSCPGAEPLRAAAFDSRDAVAQTGLPKLYSPAVTGHARRAGPLHGHGSPTGRLDGDGAANDARRVVASGTGTGTNVDWTWDASAATPGSTTRGRSAAPQMRSATGTIGSAPGAACATAAEARAGDRDAERRWPRRLGDDHLSADGAGARDRVRGRQLRATPSATLFSQRKTAGKQSFDLEQRCAAGRALPAGARRERRSRHAGADDAADLWSTARWRRSRRALRRSRRTVTAGSTPSPSRSGQRARTRPAADPARPARWSRRRSTPISRPARSGSELGRRRAARRALLGGRGRDGLAAHGQAVRLRRVDRPEPPVLRLASLRLLRFWLSEPGRLTVVLNGRGPCLAVRRAGLFRVGHRGSVRTLTAFLRDAAGNKSRQISRAPSRARRRSGARAAREAPASSSARSSSRPVSTSSDVAGPVDLRAAARSAATLTLTPIPSTTRSSRASARIPATLRPPTSTSFGNLSSGSSPVSAANASAQARAADAGQLGQPLRRDRRPQLERAEQARPCGRQPAPARAARAPPSARRRRRALPPARRVGSSSCVDGVDSTYS